MTTADEQSDASLWPAAVDGDSASFAAVFDRHVDRIYRHALRATSSAADAEDVTAMVFLEAWRLRHRVRVVEGSVLPWLLVAATNIARNTQRSRSRYDKAIARLRPEPVADHAPAVIDRLAAERLNAPVREAFASLSRTDQEVLVLCVLEKLPPRDVAKVLRVPAGAIRSRLNRAKQRLRAALDVEHLDGFVAWKEAEG